MKPIPYSHQYIDSVDLKAVGQVLRSDWLTQGPKIKEFEQALCGYTGAKYAVAVSNGTAALHIAVLVAGIKRGDEVITSPITFVASANCILFCGGRPIFADVQEDTINIDPEEIKKKINKKTKAVIPVDFAGHPCDLEEIYGVAKEKRLLIIEDAAHSLGAEYRGSKIGSCKYSDMTIFSFHPVKSITTGEGGAVLTNRKDLYEKLLMFRNHGIVKDQHKMERINEPWHYEMQELGFNYRITDFQCALGISQLKKLDKFIERRNEIVDFYNKNLSEVTAMYLPKKRSYVKSSWHLYCIRLSNPANRKYVFGSLRKAGIDIQVHYIPVHLQPYYKRKFGYKKGDYPKAEKYYNMAITLPLYPTLKPSELKYVVMNLKKILQ